MEVRLKTEKTSELAERLFHIWLDAPMARLIRSLPSPLFVCAPMVAQSESECAFLKIEREWTIRI